MQVSGSLMKICKNLIDLINKDFKFYKEGRAFKGVEIFY